MNRLVLLMCATLAASCGGGTSSPTAPSSSPAPSPAPAPPAAQNPAPQAMQGNWKTVLVGTNQSVMLRLGETTYGITRGTDGASGAIAVRGDVIEFSRSTACDGIGSYRWSLQGNLLSFTESAIGSEACSGRGEVLSGYTYTRQ